MGIICIIWVSNIVLVSTQGISKILHHARTTENPNFVRVGYSYTLWQYQCWSHSPLTLSFHWKSPWFGIQNESEQRVEFWSQTCPWPDDNRRDLTGSREEEGNASLPLRSLTSLRFSVGMPAGAGLPLVDSMTIKLMDARGPPIVIALIKDWQNSKKRREKKNYIREVGILYLYFIFYISFLWEVDQTKLTI